MDLQLILSALNSGIPSEAIGALTAHGVITLIDKVKSRFSKNENITEAKVQELLATNDEFLNDIQALEAALRENATIMIGQKNNKVGVNFGKISF